MGFRYRKSFKVGPVRFTASKSGISSSIGVKGARITRTASGKTRTTVSIPGTGISYTSDSNGSHRNNRRANGGGQNSRHIWGWIGFAWFALSWITFIKHFAGWVMLIIAALLLPVEPWQNLIRRFIKKPVKTAIIIALFILAIVVFPESESKEQAVEITDTPAVSSETIAVTEAVSDPYESVDFFFENVSYVLGDEISDPVLMDIHGVDYRTEFRLNAFKNAVGKKADVFGGTMSVISYGQSENNNLRLYANVDSLDNAKVLYENAVHMMAPSITDKEIKSQYNDSGLDIKILLGETGKITGYINKDYNDKHTDRYKVMIDCIDYK